MDLEAAFPGLAELARKHRTNLHQLAGESTDHDGYCSLRDCCWMAMQDLPRHSHADGYDYLATISTYLSIPWPRCIPPVELWRRLSTGNQSAFLDTISEVAWALMFHQRGISFEPEARFFTDPAKKTNADFLIGTRSAGLWLDVNSMELADPSREVPAGPRPAFPSVSKDWLISKLMRKGLNKYKDKFREEIVGGPLKGQPTGLLLGLHKAEKEAIPALMLDLTVGIREPVPDGLFTNLNPELTLVWVYILTRATDGSSLLPSLIFRWDHPALDPGTFDWLCPGLVTMSLAPPPYDLSGAIERLNFEGHGRGIPDS